MPGGTGGIGGKAADQNQRNLLMLGGGALAALGVYYYTKSSPVSLSTPKRVPRSIGDVRSPKRFVTVCHSRRSHLATCGDGSHSRHLEGKDEADKPTTTLPGRSQGV